MEIYTVLVFLFSFLTLFFHLCLSTTTVVDGVSQWNNPTVQVGDTVIFRHKDQYNVYVFQNRRAFDLCNFTQATLLTESSTTYTWNPSRLGFFYFAFNNGSDTACRNGQKIAIQVTSSSVASSPAGPMMPGGQGGSMSPSGSTMPGGKHGSMSPSGSMTPGGKGVNMSPSGSKMPGGQHGSMSPSGSMTPSSKGGGNMSPSGSMTPGGEGGNMSPIGSKTPGGGGGSMSPSGSMMPGGKGGSMSPSGSMTPSQGGAMSPSGAMSPRGSMSPSGSMDAMSPGSDMSPSLPTMPGEGASMGPSMSPGPSGSVPFINSNPAVPLPTGEVDSASIRPTSSSSSAHKLQDVGFLAVERALCCVVFLIMLL